MRAANQLYSSLNVQLSDVTYGPASPFRRLGWRATAVPVWNFATGRSQNLDAAVQIVKRLIHSHQSTEKAPKDRRLWWIGALCKHHGWTRQSKVLNTFILLTTTFVWPIKLGLLEVAKEEFTGYCQQSHNKFLSIPATSASFRDCSVTQAIFSLKSELVRVLECWVTCYFWCGTICWRRNTASITAVWFVTSAC